MNREVRGYLARIMQHETDHLSGIFFTDLYRPDCRHGAIEEMKKIRDEEIKIWEKEQESKK